MNKILDKQGDQDFFEIGNNQLIFPYDLPLTKYGTEDQPWFIEDSRSF